MTDSSGRTPINPDDDGTTWMPNFGSTPDDELDALLSGGVGQSAASAPLQELVAHLRSDAERHGIPAMSLALRQEIAAGRPRVVPAPRRRRVLAGALAGLLVGGSAIGVAGAQNALPAAVQDAVSTVADLVGIDLPRADEQDDVPGGDDDRPGDVQGPPTSTPGGNTPADPGTPGDHEPATPSTGNGNGNTDGGNGNGNADGGNGNGNADGGNGNGNGTGNTDGGTGNGSTNGTGGANGTGNATDGGANGTGNGTGQGTQGRGQDAAASGRSAVASTVTSLPG